jgi:hypothetical protein
MKKDASALDVIRTQAFDAVGVAGGASILHGLLEETVQMFRDSARATLDGINEVVGGREREEERIRMRVREMEKEIEEWEETAERLGGQVEEGEDRIRELEGLVDRLHGVISGLEKEVDDRSQGANEYVRSLEHQVKQLQDEMRALMGRQVQQSDGFKQIMVKEQETIDVALGEIEKLGMGVGGGGAVGGGAVGGGAGMRGGAGINTNSDQQGVNLKPFSGGGGGGGGEASTTTATTTGSRRSSPKRTAPSSPTSSTPTSANAISGPNIKGVNDPDLPSKKLIIRLNKYMKEKDINIEEQWKRMDANKDGFLSFDELFDSLKTMGLNIR